MKAEEHPIKTKEQSRRSQNRWYHFKNWWHYHKWYVLCGITVFLITANLVGNALGITGSKPDYQIAYVGKDPLPQDTVSTLEEAFASISSDFNGDGKVLVQLNQYTSPDSDTNADASYYQYAAEVTLIGDITDCESYFFLLEDPEVFQKEYQVLACPDGSCPKEADFSTEDKVIQWKDCPVLTGMKLGNYQETYLGQEQSGSNQALLTDLYIGRRCFYGKKTTDHPQDCAALWETLVP